MQVLCKSSNERAQTRCRVCGQGFVVDWERQSPTERAEALREIESTLRKHHYNQAGPEAHPKSGFLVGQWNSPIALSGAAIHGLVPPSWAL